MTKKTNHSAIALILFFTCSPATASDWLTHTGDLYLDLNGFSRHSNETYVYRGQRHNYNAINTGLGITYGVSKFIEASTGFYENSYYQDTVYGGLKIKHDVTIGDATITPGLSIGVATGYSNTPAQADYFQLVVMPVVRVTYRGVGLTIGYVPRVERENFVSVSTVTVQVSFLVWNRDRDRVSQWGAL